MIEHFVSSIVEYQLNIGTISKDEAKIYQYGYTLFIEMFLNLVLSLILSSLIGKTKECIIVLIIFIPLRSFCGGYHAKKTWQCVILSNLAILSVLIGAELLMGYHISIWMYVIADVVIAFIIVFCSPVESENNKLNESERKRFQKYACVIITIEVLVGSSILIMGHQKIFNLMFGVHVLQLLVLLVNKCIQPSNR